MVVICSLQIPYPFKITGILFKNYKCMVTLRNEHIFSPQKVGPFLLMGIDLLKEYSFQNTAYRKKL